MAMSAAGFLNTLEKDRREVIVQLRKVIAAEDPTVTEAISGMMRKEMLVYNAAGFFKYAIANTKGHISFHSMVLYGCPELHAKYSALLPKVKFQKGCINFKSLEELPLAIFTDLIRDSAAVQWPTQAHLDQQSKARKSKRKSAV